jgi:flavin reductase (DIM6/NTAB) family NADH-FMN oxidoreductase RutF
VRARKMFWLNVLNEGQEHFCSAFGGAVAGERRFSIGNWAVCEDDLPYLTDAQANILCRVEIEVPFGTHTIFVGKVLKTVSHSNIRPLVYFRGGFADVQARVAAAK